MLWGIARLHIRQLVIFIFHLLHPYFLYRVAKEHELVFMRGCVTVCVIPTISAGEFNILPSLRYELLQNRVQIIIAFIIFEKSDESVADSHTERNDPGPPIDFLVGI